MCDRDPAPRTGSAGRVLLVCLSFGLGAALATDAAAAGATNAKAGALNVLYAFKGAEDGAYPEAAPFMDVNGDLYGTTYAGGAAKCGAVYRLRKSQGGAWAQSVVYSFTCGGDGANPAGGVVMDAKGNLYGGTAFGGSGNCMSNGTLVGCGTVYALSPAKDGKWRQSTLYSWPAPNRAFEGPMASLTLDRKGTLYGTTAANNPCANDLGSVFALKPVNDSWNERDLHRFCGSGSDGSVPGSGALAIDASGNLYGTTMAGGSGGRGVVFQLSPSSGGKWQFTKIHEFTPDEGGNLQGGLTLDAAGNLYGSEMAGTSGYGAIFELSHSTAGWQEQTLAAFGGSNGIGPWQTPVFDGHGNLFGTTQRGGAAPYCGSCGVIYKLAPNGDGTWSETVVYNFGSRPNSADGATPIGGLTLGRDGNFYGTAYQGGDASYGVVYQFTP